MGQKSVADAQLASVGEAIIGPSMDLDIDDYVLEPWPGRILVQRFTSESVTQGGIHLPSDSQQIKNWGKVVRMPHHGAPPGIVVGDIVLFLCEAGDPAEAFGENLVLLEYADDFQGDIIGILRKKEDYVLDNSE